MSKINWSKPNFLVSKTANLIMVNVPNSNKESLEFEGVILSEGDCTLNKVLGHSRHYKRAKFELLSEEDINFEVKK